ncbi:MAG TPA: hypothetical protein VNU71_03605 [Burkholderiaceae bacterium]|nr:hypothetical protein [Burkholderiaceae bacterium]
MPNIASVLKSEIARIARKEIRNEVDGLKKAVGTYRTEIAALKRRSESLERQLRKVGKALPESQAPSTEESGKPVRFSAKGLTSQRKRLGLSAEACGLLIGASGQSVYNWEAGSARPRAKHLEAIAALKTLGKKQAAQILASRTGSD